jgi:hypothetical protein
LPDQNRLHIITLDVPYPADYGGAIDIFYRIKAFSELGFQLTIHVFEYGRGKQQELEKFGKVIYYPRSFSFFKVFSKIPFIVNSRKSADLLKNLLKDEVPIFFDGLHTTFYLSHPLLKNRMTYVRMHNIEHEYYFDLAKGAHIFKKLFFKLESYKLKNYEKILKNANQILAIKEEDQDHFKEFNRNTEVLPASIPEFNSPISETKKYALFHGNLSVSENEMAIFWILNSLKEKLTTDFPLLVAGKNPSQKVLNFCNSLNVKVIANPDENLLRKLISEAQIHVFYTESPSGVKLKLLNALNSKGHILMNEAMTNDEEVKRFCEVVISKKEFLLKFEQLKSIEFSIEEFDKRTKFLKENFSTKNNLKKLFNNF